jgi:pimeloyl-ACP methyl ester carboxylesterase
MVGRMPIFERSNGVSLYYEEHGQGFPLLLLAPGGMRSSMAFWQRTPFNPIAEFANEFRVIAMDQRNAGQSRAPISALDGWHSYTADHVALLDHLGIARCHLLGGCIGGSFCLGLLTAAPERVAAAVLQQPIGHTSENRATFYALVDDWAKEIANSHPEATPEVWAALREQMYGGDFVFNVSRDAVRNITAPLLVLMGNDIYHPSPTSREIVALAQHATLIERWKEPDAVPEVVHQVREFLRAHQHSSC